MCHLFVTFSLSLAVFRLQRELKALPVSVVEQWLLPRPPLHLPRSSDLPLPHSSSEGRTRGLYIFIVFDLRHKYLIQYFSDNAGLNYE
jgi:hypothetical protein